MNNEAIYRYEHKTVDFGETACRAHTNPVIARGISTYHNITRRYNDLISGTQDISIGGRVRPKSAWNPILGHSTVTSIGNTATCALDAEIALH